MSLYRSLHLTSYCGFESSERENGDRGADGGWIRRAKLANWRRGVGWGHLRHTRSGYKQTNEMRLHVSIHVEEMRKGHEKMRS